MSLNSMRNTFHTLFENKYFKPVIFSIVAILGGGLAFSGLGTNLGGRNLAGATTSAASDATVATVNGDTITRSELDQAVDNLKNQSQNQQYSGISSIAYYDNSALDQLITGKMLMKQALKSGLTVSDKEIQNAREKIANQSGLRQTLGLPATASLAEIDDALARNGSASLEIRYPDDDVRQAVLMNKLQEFLASKVIVTEQDARNYYQQWHTRHILIKNSGRSDAQAENLAEQVLEKAKAPGADFAALAKQYSEDPGTKNKGGDDGWIDQSTQYVPEFKTAAFMLKAGEITPAVVKSPAFGYFIIKCDAIRSNLPKDFDKKKADYISQIKQQKTGDSEEAFVKSVKDDPANKIVVSDPMLRAEFNDAQTSTDPMDRNAKFQSALADYQTALKDSSLNSTDKAVINSQIAMIYQRMNEKPQAIAAYEAAVAASDDPQLRLSLGTLYMQSNNQDKAVENFQVASKDAWDDQNLHMQLMMNYNQMKRKDLAAQESDWLKQYQKDHPQPTASSGGTPIQIGGANGAQPVVVSPGNSGAHPVVVSTGNGSAKPIVVRTGPAPAAKAVVGQVQPAAPKPAQ